MKKLNKKGFTLVELLAVIIILGLLMVVAASVMGNVQDNAKKSTLETEAKKIMTSLTNEAKSLSLLGEIKTTDFSTNFPGKDGDYYYNAEIDKTTGEVKTFKMCLGKFYIEKSSGADLGEPQEIASNATTTCDSTSVHDSGKTPGVTVS